VDRPIDTLPEPGALWVLEEGLDGSWSLTPAEVLAEIHETFREHAERLGPRPA
jgi:hypothetical protein